MVRNGQTDLAITGGSEAPFSFGILKAWEAMRVVSPETCRPFSKDRKGMVLGEGAAMMVLEPMDAALARGARIHAEIVGFGMSADASHITQPSAEGAAKAMRAALRDAGVDASQIGYVNAHGTGTLANDISESAAIHAVFGARAGALPVSSTKSMHGHALGAAAAIELLATVLAVRDGVLPPTANYNEPDPESPISTSSPMPRAFSGRRICALEFLRVRRFERRPRRPPRLIERSAYLHNLWTTRITNPPLTANTASSASAGPVRP